MTENNEDPLRRYIDDRLHSVEQQLPFNEHAERDVLTAILCDSTLIWRVKEIISHQDFMFGMHSHIFKAMSQLAIANEAITAVTIDNKMQANGQQIPGGGIIYISNMIVGHPGFSINATLDLAIIIKNKSRARAGILRCREVESALKTESDDSTHIIGRAATQFFELGHDIRNPGLTPIGESIAVAIAEAQRAGQLQSTVTGLATGLIDVDTKSSGWQPHDLIIVAARPSMGKTALMLNWATHAAIELGKKVPIFSLEMSKTKLTHRIICARTGIDSQRFKNGFLTADEWRRVAEEGEVIANSGIYIDDSAAISTGYMQGKLNALVSEDGVPIDLICVDYMQMMSANRSGGNRYEEITQISRELKALAKLFNCPVVALSQLSRAPESRNPPKPIMSDLRESGAIEQDADYVAFIYREAYYKPTLENANLAEILLSKNRNGPTGTCHAIWDETTGNFRNAERNF